MISYQIKILIKNISRGAMGPFELIGFVSDIV